MTVGPPAPSLFEGRASVFGSGKEGDLSTEALAKTEAGHRRMGDVISTKTPGSMSVADRGSFAPTVDTLRPTTEFFDKAQNTLAFFSEVSLKQSTRSPSPRPAGRL